MKSTKSFGPSSASLDVCPVCRRKPYERHGVVNVCEHYDKPFISDEEHLRTVKQLYENAKFDGASTIRLTVEQVEILLNHPGGDGARSDSRTSAESTPTLERGLIIP